jgi:hypothetical protein
MPTLSEWMSLLCDAMIPAMAISLALEAYRDWRRVLPPLLLSLGWVYVWQSLDRAFDVWGSFDLDYSSHAAVAMAVGTSLASRSLTWLVITLAWWITYAALMRHLGYHTLGDIASTALIVLPFCALVVRFIGRRETDHPTPAQD